VATTTRTRDLEAKEQKLIKSGMPRLDTIPEPTGPAGIHRTGDGRYWVQHTGGARVGEDKHRMAFTLEGETMTVWRQVDTEEAFLAEKKVAEEEAARADEARTVTYLADIIKSAHRVRIVPGDHPGLHRVAPSLDAVEDLVAKTGAKVTVAKSGHGVIVEAALESELVALAERSKSQQPKYGLKKISGHDNRVRLLVDLLVELGPLGIEWARTGTRPASDTDRGKANRVDRLGAFTS
jgi:hypothetical protein